MTEQQFVDQVFALGFSFVLAMFVAIAVSLVMHLFDASYEVAYPITLVVGVSTLVGSILMSSHIISALTSLWLWG